MSTFRPSTVCRALLVALEASECLSRMRKRDQTPDSIGLALRRDLLKCVVQHDPEPDAFEQWLLDAVERSLIPGAMRATARALYDDWLLAQHLGAKAFGGGDATARASGPAGTGSAPQDTQGRQD